MIEALRSHASGWIAKILIGLLAISFAVWGIGDMFRPPQNNVLATVGDQEITSEGFERAFDREVRAFGERAGTNITAEQARAIGIDREVLKQLLSGAALDNQAARLDLRLADAYVARLLAENPAFHDASGQFSPERFRQVLRASGLGEQEVIRSERDAMISNSIIDAVAADPAVPSTLTEIAWLHRNEQRDARWFTLPAATVTVPEPAKPAWAAVVRHLGDASDALDDGIVAVVESQGGQAATKALTSATREVEKAVSSFQLLAAEAGFECPVK